MPRTTTLALLVAIALLPACNAVPVTVALVHPTPAPIVSVGSGGLVAAGGGNLSVTPGTIVDTKEEETFE